MVFCFTVDAAHGVVVGDVERVAAQEVVAGFVAGVLVKERLRAVDEREVAGMMQGGDACEADEREGGQCDDPETAAFHGDDVNDTMRGSRMDAMDAIQDRGDARFDADIH